jgi:hypothetical protein
MQIYVLAVQNANLFIESLHFGRVGTNGSCHKVLLQRSTFRPPGLISYGGIGLIFHALAGLLSFRSGKDTQ